MDPFFCGTGETPQFFATYTNNQQKERWKGEDGGIEMLQRPSSGDGKWVTFARGIGRAGRQNAKKRAARRIESLGLVNY